MKVLFLSHHDKLYGANRSLLTLVEGLLEFGVESVVGVPDFKGELANHLRSRSVQLFEFETQPWCISHHGKLPRFVLPFKFAREIWWRLKRWRQAKKQANTILVQAGDFHPDVIYTNTAVTPEGYFLAKKLSLPHVWHLREYCDLDYNLYLILGRKISTLIIGKSERVICISESVKRHYFSNPNTNIHVVHNGVYSSKQIDRLYHEHRLARLDCSEFVFVLVGLIHPNKQQKVTIQAFINARQRVNSIKLKIVGGGDQDYTNQLKSLVLENGIEGDVSFCGYLTDPSLELINADCALMCSAFEGFGRVTAEAMATGIPVIGNNSGGTPEIVENGIDGLLYDGSVEHLTECMVRMASNPSKASSMGEIGHKKAKRKFSSEIYSRRVFEILSEVVNS
ncbi:MAG: glycosyltransferase family 4 protein [bacterium]